MEGGAICKCRCRLYLYVCNLHSITCDTTLQVHIAPVEVHIAPVRVQAALEQVHSISIGRVSKSAPGWTGAIFFFRTNPASGSPNHCFFPRSNFYCRSFWTWSKIQKTRFQEVTGRVHLHLRLDMNLHFLKWLVGGGLPPADAYWVHLVECRFHPYGCNMHPYGCNMHLERLIARNWVHVAHVQVQSAPAMAYGSPPPPRFWDWWIFKKWIFGWEPIPADAS